jgi:AraC-like DNA-binding protein
MNAFDPLQTPPRVTLANFYPFAPGEIAGPHWSESDLFLPATNGRGEILLGPRKFELVRGQILHVPWAAPIQYRADRHDPFVLIGVHFKYVPWAEPVAQPLHSSRRVGMSRDSMQRPPTQQPFAGPFLITPSPESRLLDIAISIANVYEGAKRNAPDADREARLRALALEFLLEVRALRQGLATAAAHPQAGVVREMISWLELSYQRRIRRSELAERAGISESSLAEAFRAVTGRAPIDYLIDLRLAHATTLLRTSRQRINEIAEQVGVPDVYYFSKLFKSRLGVSPLQYRKQRRL